MKSSGRLTLALVNQIRADAFVLEAARQAIAKAPEPAKALHSFVQGFLVGQVTKDGDLAWRLLNSALTCIDWVQVVRALEQSTQKQEAGWQINQRAAQEEAERPWGQPANFDETPEDFEPDPDLYYQGQQEAWAEQLGDPWTGGPDGLSERKES